MFLGVGDFYSYLLFYVKEDGLSVRVEEGVEVPYSVLNRFGSYYYCKGKRSSTKFLPVYRFNRLLRTPSVDPFENCL